jgi:hypothetical protein
MARAVPVRTILLAAGVTLANCGSCAQRQSPPTPTPERVLGEFDVLDDGGPSCADSMKAAFAFAGQVWPHERIVVDCRDGMTRVLSLNGAEADRHLVEEACGLGCAAWRYSRGARVMMCGKIWPGDGQGMSVPGYGDVVTVERAGTDRVNMARVRRVFHSNGRKVAGGRWRLPAFPEAPLDDALILAARDVVPLEMAHHEMMALLKWGVWDGDRTAFAVAFRRGKGTAVVVFSRRGDGTYRAVDVSDVEPGNLGKLGSHGQVYERVETEPMDVSRRADGSLVILVRTRAWRGGRRYAVTEPVLIEPDGEVLWR